jgi:hypothetical protein
MADDLRTALTSLVAHYKRAYPERAMHAPAVRDLDALLAAHPAPETDMEAAKALCLADTSWEHHDRTDDFPCSSCVSDTRREDVARAIEHAIRQSFQSDDHAHTYRRAARAVLAVLPAPPVVDEAGALIEAHVAEFEASIARLEASIQDPNNTVGGREYDTAKLHGQRGAVYALRRLADEIAARPRGATRG